MPDVELLLLEEPKKACQQILLATLDMPNNDPQAITKPFPKGNLRGGVDVVQSIVETAGCLSESDVRASAHVLLRLEAFRVDR